MGWEPWAHRKRRLADLLAAGTIPLYAGRYELPYLGRVTPFPSDYVRPDWARYVIPSLKATFPGAFVDVGANIGQTLLLVKNADADWRYVGFEPNPVSFVILRQLVRANGLSGCQLIPAGLSDRSGLLELESNFDTDPASSLVSGFRAPGRMTMRSHAVVVGGDEALASVDCGRVGMLKIDVEGGELEVLRGLQDCLATSRPLVACEVLALHDGNSVGDFRVHRQRAVEEVLRAHAFSIFRIEPPQTLRRVPEVPDDGRRDLTDYFFVPDERRRDFEAALAAGGFVVA